MPTQIRLFAALAVAGGLVLSAAPVWAGNGDTMMFKLDSVTFDGNARVKTETLNSVVGIAPGDKVNRDSIVKAFGNVQDEYTKENVGGSIQPKMTIVKHDHLVVVFEIKEEAPPVTKVIPLVADHETFTGNAKVSTDKLQAALTIKPGDVLTSDKVNDDLKALVAVYKSTGLGVMITPQITKVAVGHDDLNYEINEHPPSK